MFDEVDDLEDITLTLSREQWLLLSAALGETFMKVHPRDYTARLGLHLEEALTLRKDIKAALGGGPESDTLFDALLSMEAERLSATGGGVDERAASGERAASWAYERGDGSGTDIEVGGRQVSYASFDPTHERTKLALGEDVLLEFFGATSYRDALGVRQEPVEDRVRRHVGAPVERVEVGRDRTAQVTFAGGAALTVEPAGERPVLRVRGRLRPDWVSEKSAEALK